MLHYLFFNFKKYQNFSKFFNFNILSVLYNLIMSFNTYLQRMITHKPTFYLSYYIITLNLKIIFEL